MSDLKWKARTVPAAAVDALARRHRLEPLAAKVLAARGWEAGAELTAFLSTPDEAAPDPLGLVDAEKAARRLWSAIDAGERITICGDYDVDGTTGTALLLSFLEQLGADVDYFLPDRHVDGYGLNAPTISRLAATGTKVIVTVDNGITSYDELALAKQLGIDAIVTDHHTPGETPPVAYAIVNPRLMAEAGPFAPLAGVGVAYILTQAMVALRPGTAADPDESLDLVAIGTIGDQAPLAGENRRLVKLGLVRIAERPRIGLALLAEHTRVNLTDRHLAESISFRLVPRLNAAGRMAHARFALELLLATDPREARERVEHLDALNRERQRQTAAIESQCHARLEAELAPDLPAIVLWDAHWHPGVMGVVAARLAERYGLPTLLFARDIEGWRASGRTAQGLDLHATLTRLAHHLGRFGGHRAAVGCTVEDGGLEAFKADFLAECRRALGAGPPEPAWEVDAEVPLSDLTLPSVEGLKVLEPTGNANPAPTLASRAMTVARQGVRGPEGQHLWLEVEGQFGKIEAIGFGMGHLHPVDDRIDAVFVPVAEEWRGKRRLQLRLLAIAGLG